MDNNVKMRKFCLCSGQAAKEEEVGDKTVKTCT